MEQNLHTQDNFIIYKYNTLLMMLRLVTGSSPDFTLKLTIANDHRTQQRTPIYRKDKKNPSWNSTLWFLGLVNIAAQNTLSSISFDPSTTQASTLPITTGLWYFSFPIKVFFSSSRKDILSCGIMLQRTHNGRKKQHAQKTHGRQLRAIVIRLSFHDNC